jgi:chloramphenicol O-acetyltransferase
MQTPFFDAEIIYEDELRKLMITSLLGKDKVIQYVEIDSETDFRLFKEKNTRKIKEYQNQLAFWAAKIEKELLIKAKLDNV